MRRNDILVFLFSLFVLSFVYNACVSRKNKATDTKLPTGYVDTLFSEHVRTSEAKTPEEERLSFWLPEGFEISLYASEPLIGKPININFDAKGRLWVTQSFEYPFAAQPGTGRDMITILEDKDGDGKADSFTHFADSLNIPIGILPVHGGAIAYSIPNIYKFIDKDGDGKAESRKALIGPFGHKDTHGMVNSLTRGYDGWVNSDHGFSNISKVAGTDGDSITMESGNTFRFLPDGSHVEQTTFGRVNPFGICFDEWGYMYSSDCHSSPIYQLITGGNYPHFGKVEEGIGFAPAMKPHDDESTALAGLAYYKAEEFPKEYQNDFYLGDVVKARVYRNSFSFKESTPIAKREEDFLISADPWFRPVDVKLGPDGALYIADFYNRIIGHYEVPLLHPGRDRIRGRIWRISYKGKTTKPKDLSVASAKELVNQLGNANITVRMHAADQLVERIGEPAVSEVRALMQLKEISVTPYVHSLWVLERLKALTNEELMNAVNSNEAQIKVHALRIVAQRKNNQLYFDAVKNAMKNENPHVKRAAVETIIQFPSLNSVESLLRMEPTIDTADSHLRYTMQLSLRTLLRNETIARQVAAKKWAGSDMQTLIKVMIGVQNKPAAEILFQYLKENPSLAKEKLMIILLQVARFQAAEHTNDLVRFTTSHFSTDDDAQIKIFNIIQQGLDQAGAAPGNEMKEWGTALAEKFISGIQNDWWYTTDGIMKRNPLVTHKAWKSKKNVIAFDSPGFVGNIYSPAFEIPSSLKFFVCLADKPSTHEKSASLQEVRLLSVEDNSVLKKETFLRDQDYQELDINWDLYLWKGKKAYLEVINNAPPVIGIIMGEGGFLKVGGFEPGVVSLPESSPAKAANLQLFALQIVSKYNLERLVPGAKEILLKKNQDNFLKIAAARALMQINDKEYAPIINSSLQDNSSSEAYKKDLIALLGEFPSSHAIAVLKNNFTTLPKSLQVETVRALANSPEGIDVILKKVRTGDIYTRILLEPKIEERIGVVATAKQLNEYKELTANLNPVDDERQKLIKDRLAAFKYSPEFVAQGQAVFIQQCSACHQIKKSGGMIGPQLDGIGNWGATALAEKVLNPNQNISEAFRTYTIKLKNGKVITGLYRRDEGAVTVFANMLGEEFQIPKKDIAERKASKYSLMPDHFGQVIPPDQFNALLAFLLNNK